MDLRKIQKVKRWDEFSEDSRFETLIFFSFYVPFLFSFICIFLAFVRNRTKP